MHTTTRHGLVLTTALTGALALGLALPVPAAAHGDTLHVIVTGHRDGHVLTEVTWENDGDPVEEKVAAVVSAVSTDGSRTAGPWKLVRGSGPTGYTTAEALPAGTWKITVDAGFPGLGHGERQLTVTTAPSATASSVPGRTAAVPTPTPAPKTSTGAGFPSAASGPKDARKDSDTGTGGDTVRDGDTDHEAAGLTAAVLAVAALAGAAAGMWIRRSRRRRR
ncbi:hypothetical protein ACIGEZ_19380 [Streptomyces sp. NPDC085481]|uniref:hypothetical protein n=1 Tax=Streptomyces sp. NPDC085481 TaxID=3365727 RepID=UPI0037D05AC3